MPEESEPSDGGKPKVPELAPKLKLAAELSQGYTVAEAARRVGVPHSTAHDWSKQSDVIGEVRRLRGAALRRASNVLAEASTAAAIELVSIVRDTKVSPYARVQAAQAILTNARGLVAEIDVVERIEALEERDSGEVIPSDLVEGLRLIVGGESER